MANTNHFSKAISLVDYQPAFITGSKTQRWPWQEFFTTKQTDRLTEQIFSYTPLPLPRQTGESEPFYFGESSELGAITYTMVKYTLSHRLSYELMKYDKHIRDLAKKRGRSAGDAHSYLRDQVVAQIFNRAFNSSYPSYDSVELCGSHTLDNGTAYDNDLTPASLDFDNLWSMINHFATSTYNHAGLLIQPKARWLLTNPTNRKTVEKILEAEYEPDQANWNPQTLKQFALKPVYCPHLTSTTAYFLIAEEAKDDFMFWNVETPRYIDEDDNNVHGTNFFSWQIFTAGFHEHINVVGNPGA
jgi:hypothetical protein